MVKITTCPPPFSISDAKCKCFVFSESPPCWKDNAVRMLSNSRRWSHLSHQVSVIITDGMFDRILHSELLGVSHSLEQLGPCQSNISGLQFYLSIKIQWPFFPLLPYPRTRGLPDSPLVFLPVEICLGWIWISFDYGKSWKQSNEFWTEREKSICFSP